MADDRVLAKAEAALAAAGGDRHDAQKLLITWAVRDPELLLGLVKPHLKAIAAGLLDHTARMHDFTPAPEAKVGSGRTAIDDLVAAASLKLPQEKRKKSNLPPPKSTERQASAMRKLVEAFGKKKGSD